MIARDEAATLRDQSPDGHLLVVSSDLRRAVSAARIAPNLLAALESWERTAPALAALSAELARGGVPGEIALDEAKLASPLPRTWQWLDGSAFPSHGELMQRAFGQAIVDENRTQPLMYQGGSDDFLGPRQDMPVPWRRTASTSRPRSQSLSIACRWARTQPTRSSM